MPLRPKTRALMDARRAISRTLMNAQHAITNIPMKNAQPAKRSQSPRSLDGSIPLIFAKGDALK